MKLKFLGFALLAVCVCAVCCMCGSDSKTPDYEFPDGPDPDPDPQPGDYPAGLTVTEFTDDLGGGKPGDHNKAGLGTDRPKGRGRRYNGFCGRI